MAPGAGAQGLRAARDDGARFGRAGRFFHQRRGLPVAGRAAHRGRPYSRDRRRAAPYRVGHRQQHRQRCDHHRQSAEHDRRRLRSHRLFGLRASSRAGRGREPAGRLCRDRLALSRPPKPHPPARRRPAFARGAAGAPLPPDQVFDRRGRSAGAVRDGLSDPPGGAGRRRGAAVHAAHPAAIDL